MIIDIHTHTYPDSIAEKTVEKLSDVAGIKPHTNGTLDGLVESTKEAGIDYSVILPVATDPHQVPTINEYAYKTNISYKRKGIISFGGIHPDSPDIARVIRGIASLGIKGIKLHPDYQGVFFNDVRYKRIVLTAASYGLYTIVHAGVDIGMPEPVHTTPDMVREVMNETGVDRVILAHMGGWRMWDEVMEKLVDLPTMRKLYNKTCAQGDVYRGQVVGFLDGADDTARAEVVVDGSTIPPRQVFYKDLTTLGKGFNAAVLLGGLTADDAQNGLDGTGADGSANVASFDLIDIENARASGYNVNANRAADPFAAIDSVVDRANAELGLDPSAGQDMTANAFGTAPDPAAANNGALGGDDSFATGDAATAPGGETAGSEPTRRERMLESLQQARRQRQTRYDSLANANRQEAQEPQATQETTAPAQEPEYSVPTPRTNQTNRTNRTQPEEQDSGGGAATGGRASDGNADSDGPAARRARLLETLRAAREQRQSRYSSETDAGESEP